MTHEQIEQQISQLLDAEVEEELSPQFFHHLSDCGSCRMFLQSTIEVRATIRKGSPVYAPSSLDDRMRQALASVPTQGVDRAPRALSFMRKFKARSSPTVTLSRPLAIVFMLVTLSVGLALGSFVVRTDTPRSKPKEVYIMSLPAVEVQGYRIPNKPVGQ